MSKSRWSKVFGVGVILALMTFAGSGSCVAAPGFSSTSRHDGEKMSRGNLLEVTAVGGGQIRLTFERPELVFVAPNFTVSQCGRELPPTLATLMGLIGKRPTGWAYYVDGKALYHRLEFDCQ